MEERRKMTLGEIELEFKADDSVVEGTINIHPNDLQRIWRYEQGEIE